MKLVVCEKPSVAQAYDKVLGATNRHNGYLEGGGYVVSWCVGHLVELAESDAYDKHYKKWDKNDLPIVPQTWKYQVTTATKKQFAVLKELMHREDVGSLVCATDAGWKAIEKPGKADKDKPLPAMQVGDVFPVLWSGVGVVIPVSHLSMRRILGVVLLSPATAELIFVL